MNTVQTFRLTVWIPTIVVSLFLILFGIQVYNEFAERQRLVIENAQNNLKETALQLAHNLEYALANNDQQQAQSHIARSSLRRDASFSVLLNPQQQIIHASRFAWVSESADRIFNPQQLTLIKQTAENQQIRQQYTDGILNIAVPLTQSGHGVIAAGEDVPVLFIESNIDYQLQKISHELWKELLPVLVLFVVATFLLMLIIRAIVLKPLFALKKLARQLSQQQFDLQNPLKGQTEQTDVAETLVNAGKQFKQYIAEITDRERRLSITLQSIGDAVIVSDANGLITRINPVACRLTGWPEQQALGQPLLTIFDIYHATTHEPIANPVSTVLATGETVELDNQTVLYSRDGGRYHISDSAAPIRAQDDPHAPILGVILVFQDVTQQYQLRQELRQSVDFLQNMLRVTPSVTYVLDILPGPVFQLVYVTEAVETMTGENAQYWLANAQNWLSHIHPDDVESVQKTLQKALNSSKPITNRFRFKHREGHYIHVQDHLSATPHHDAPGDRRQIVGVVLDISAQQQTIAENQLLGDILERSVNEIYIIDADSLNFMMVNQGARNNLGYTMDELRQMTPLDLKRDFNREQLMQKFRPLLQNQQSRMQFETEHCRKDNSRYPVSVSVQLDRYGDRKVFVVIADDISERKRIEKALLEERSLLRGIIDSTPDMIFCKDTTGVYIRCNKAVEQLLALSEAEIIGKTDFDLFSEAEARRFVEHDRLAISRGISHLNEETLSYPDGHQVLLETLKTPFRNDKGETLGTLGISRDITQQRRAEQALHLAGMVFESSNEGIIITDADNRIIRVNPAFTAITGYLETDVIGQNPSLLQSGKHDSHFYQELWRALDAEGNWSGEIHNRRKNGEIYLQWLSITQVNNREGERQNYVAIMSDISKFREAEQRISFLAHHDVLTRLPNRALLSDRIRQAIIACDRHDQKLALLYMDLDRFKFINDSLGHAIGDLLLIAVADRLIEHKREQDTVCRTGGDEFIVLLPDTDAEGAAHVAQKLVEKMTEPFDIEGNQLFVTLSIGISIYPDNGNDAETLNKHADTAMYRAKHAGRNQYQFFTEEMHSQIVHKLELEHALRFALAGNELYLEYQPQIDIHANRINGAEALLRWQHPQLGKISPLEFIPIAEETGMINPIGNWILHNAIAQCKQWVDAGHSDLLMAINLSAVQFNNPHLVSTIVDILHEHQLPPENLELEITESVAMFNIDLTIKQLRALADNGIRLSLDDFGTGYSSLNYLKKFPINKLKIDQGFVFDMLVDEDDAAIVDAVITLARSLGLKTLAEGVETHAHLLALQEKGCDFMQGFYFSRPVGPAQFISLINKRPLP
ncbi:MAG TPA: PAS domain S-box protein [Methylophaga sp.]|nr:PAS domain S-box protein [Methylophaga sp.]